MPLLQSMLDRIFGFNRRQFVWIDPRSLETIDIDGLRDLAAFLEALKPAIEEEASLLETALAIGDRRLLEVWLAMCLRARRAYDHFYVLPLRGRRNRDWIDHLAKWSGFRVTSLHTRGKMTEVYSTLLHSLRQTVTMSQEMPADFNDIWRQVTITFGPVPRHEYFPDEPLQRAMLRAARDGTTIVVAAGNEGSIIEGNSLNPWSCAPWVVSVGATDRAGSELLPISSCGVPGLEYEAPTLVAPGEVDAEDGLNHVHRTALVSIQNSPGKTQQTVVDGDQVFIYSKHADGHVTVRMIQDGEPTPEAPLESMLEWLRSECRSKVEHRAGTSYAAEYVAGVCNKIAVHVKAVRPALERRMRPKIVKAILEDMAQPLKGYEPWEAGRGVVTSEIATDYLARLPANRLDELCARSKHRWS